MATQNFFILTAAQSATAKTFDSMSLGLTVRPRKVDSASPGSGINLNELAADFLVGAAVPLAGRYVAPVRIVNDPEYLAGVPLMVAYLLTLPSAILETETIFLPPPPEE